MTSDAFCMILSVWREAFYCFYKKAFEEMGAVNEFLHYIHFFRRFFAVTMFVMVPFDLIIAIL